MDPAYTQQEHARLTNLYRDMGDEELESVAAEAYDLTDLARECLAIEIGNRRLKVPLNLTPPVEEAEPLPPSDDGFVPDESDVVSIATAHDMQELLSIQALLTQGGFECFLGDDRVRDPKDLLENFDVGVEMRVWKAAAQRAMAYLAYNRPGGGQQTAHDTADEDEDLAVLCPKCKSDGVIFEERDLTSTGGRLTRSSKFLWRCDDCGYEWEDDGIASEKTTNA